MSYEKNDPKGWCGDPRRGAAMGRRDLLPADAKAPIRLHLSKVRLSDGYDRLGTYWGDGTQLWWAHDRECDVEVFVRAADRQRAAGRVRQILPAATFVGGDGTPTSANIRRRIVRGAALTVLESAYLHIWECYGGDGRPVIQTSVPRCVQTHVDEWFSRLLDTNKMTPIDLWSAAAEASGNRATPERLGELLAYQAMGSGVRWSDYHDNLRREDGGEVAVPHLEDDVFYRFDLDRLLDAKTRRNFNTPNLED